MDFVPVGTTVAAVRGPIAESAGYAWFANRGVGRPLPDSIKALDSGTTWLVEVRCDPDARPPITAWDPPS